MLRSEGERLSFVPLDSSLEEQIRDAFVNHDLSAFESLLADNVRWGDDDNPRRCRGPSEVMANFSRMMSAGVDADITELSSGTRGILCGLRVRWPEGMERRGDVDLYQVYRIVDGRITEIQRFNDIESARESAGI